MLITFKSSATEPITMFEDAAVELLKLMGATGRIPGGLSPEDLPAALARLEAAVEELKAGARQRAAAPPAQKQEQDDDRDADDREPPVAITTRAVPLLDLMRRAVAAKAELVWEGAS